MQRKVLRVAQAAALLAAAACAATIGYRQWAVNQQPTKFDWHSLPKNGYVYHDTNGEVPGNLENGVQGLKKLYGVIQIFRKRHDGKYPEKTMEIITDCMLEPSAYGVKDYKGLMEGLYNPDNQYGDNSYRKPHHMLTVSTVSRRPDGTLVGSPKPPGTRDLIGISDLYFHQNIRIYSEGHSTENPVGWHLLLWDDGTVEKLPYDKILYVEIGPKTWKFGYPGQAGLPKTGVSTYDEWYKRSGWQAGPRGVRGGPGFSDDSYNPPKDGTPHLLH